MASNININGNTSFIDTTRANENVPAQKQLTENKTPSISSIQENAQEKVDMHINKNLTTATPTTGPSVDTVTAQMKPTGDSIHTDPINQIFNPKKINGTQNEQAILNALKGMNGFGEKSIIKDDGNIDFQALGLSKKQIEKNQIQGKVWIDYNGKFQVKVNGYLGDDLRSAFIALKDNVDIAAKKSGLQNPITLDPNVLGKPSEPDRQVMERGGQIQYRALEGNKTLKLVLDPGKDGKDDGLTVSVLADYRGNEIKSIKTSAKIPLSVVFEGQALEGSDVRTPKAFLPNWREQQYFKRAEIKSEWFFSHKTSDNANSVDRTQAQNDLWKGVNEYLKWSVEQKEEYGSIETGSGNKTDTAIKDGSGNAGTKVQPIEEGPVKNPTRIAKILDQLGKTKQDVAPQYRAKIYGEKTSLKMFEQVGSETIASKTKPMSPKVEIKPVTTKNIHTPTIETLSSTANALYQKLNGIDVAGLENKTGNIEARTVATEIIEEKLKNINDNLKTQIKGIIAEIVNEKLKNAKDSNLNDLNNLEKDIADALAEKLKNIKEGNLKVWNQDIADALAEKIKNIKEGLAIEKFKTALKDFQTLREGDNVKAKGSAFEGKDLERVTIALKAARDFKDATDWKFQRGDVGDLVGMGQNFETDEHKKYNANTDKNTLVWALDNFMKDAERLTQAIGTKYSSNNE